MRIQNERINNEKECEIDALYNSSWYAITIFNLTSILQPYLFQKWISKAIVLIIYQIVFVINSIIWKLDKVFLIQSLVQIVGLIVIH